MDKFWELFERSIIIQSTITLLLIGSIIYMYLTEMAVEKELVQFTSLVLGFWFGSKVENAASRQTIKRLQDKEY